MMRFQRRQRTTFTKQQLDALHSAFKLNNYPDANNREELAKESNLHPSQVQVWFQNQRAKQKKGRCLLSDDDLAFSAATAEIQQTLSFQQHLQQQQTSATRSSEATSSLEQQRRLMLADNHFVIDRPMQIYVFDSVTANEAALAISEGKCRTLIEYHRKKHSNRDVMLSRQDSGASSLSPTQLDTSRFQIESNLGPRTENTSNMSSSLESSPTSSRLLSCTSSSYPLDRRQANPFETNSHRGHCSGWKQETLLENI